MYASATSDLYASWQVSNEVSSDSEQLLNYIGHKLAVAGKSLEKLNQVKFTGCDSQAQERLEAFFLII